MKRAIVIGATSGIGEGLAKKLAADGYKVGITGRRSQLLEDLKKRYPEQFITKTFDVIDTEKSIKSIEELIGELGGLDLLILNSGVGYDNLDFDYQFEKNLIDINVIGFTNIANWTYRFFKEQGKGHLVAITSIAGLRGRDRATAYHASKAYQSNYIEGLQHHVVKSKSSVRISNIRPGYIRTALIENNDFFWTMPLEKAVNQIYKAIKSQKKEVYITKRWKVMALLMTITPKSIYHRLKIT